MHRHCDVFHRLNRRLRDLQSTSFSGIDPDWFYSRGVVPCGRDLVALKKRFASRRPSTAGQQHRVAE